MSLQSLAPSSSSLLVTAPFAHFLHETVLPLLTVAQRLELLKSQWSHSGFGGAFPSSAGGTEVGARTGAWLRFSLASVFRINSLLKEAAH